jgi:hypothetical protein
MRRGVRADHRPTVIEVQRATIAYPGGLTARYRWGGSGSADEVFALSESSGSLTDHVALAGGDAARMCRAELRMEGPLGEWTARFASPVFDRPASQLWDSEALLVIKYGFLAYALASRTGELRWSHRSGTPLVAVLGSTRLSHVVLQSEVETLALDATGSVTWRVAHSDVIAAAERLGGRLVLTSFAGDVAVLDPATGRTQGP